uniref:Immunoglobulin subtype domain-containing protein n=1 Tax=Fundulus heteroclitus TaxID=8078 RepID=A0A3Q2P3W8_FUNHE
MSTCPKSPWLKMVISALQDGDTKEPRRGEEGTNITVRCSFRFSGSRRFFCRETCEGENILIETTDDRAQRGRYSILYEEKDFASFDLMDVSITGLKTSDSGRYWCRLDKTWAGTLYDDFDLVVTEGEFSPKNLPSLLFLCPTTPKHSTLQSVIHPFLHAT